MKNYNISVNLAKFSIIQLDRELKLPLQVALSLCVVKLIMSFTGTYGWSFSIIEMYRLGVLPIAFGMYALYFLLMHIFSGIFPWWRSVGIALIGLVVTAIHIEVSDYRGPPNLELQNQLNILFSWMGAMGIGSLIIGYNQVATNKQRSILNILALGMLVVLLGEIVDPALDITELLHPATFDSILFHFDQAFGTQPSVKLAIWTQGLPFFRDLITRAYQYMPLGFAVLFALQLRYPDYNKVNLPGFWLGSAIACWVFYHLTPVAGPVYLFANAFPWHVPSPENVPPFRLILAPAARNGVPSMHFGWALALWLGALPFLNKRPILVGYSLLLAFNIIATMALGEHYLLDLVIAVPFVLAIFVCFIRKIDTNRRHAFLIGGIGLFALWQVFVHFGINLAQQQPWTVIIASALTLCWGVWVVINLAKNELSNAGSGEHDPINIGTQTQPYQKAAFQLAGLFVLSGFSGLAYEVVFAKALALTFGSTALATYTVMATFMGGIAIGAWLGGLIAERTERPLLAYALCELAIGGYCAITPLLFPALQTLYVAIATGLSPSAGIVTALRFALGGALLVLPTVLMGMTLPLLLRHFNAFTQHHGQSVSLLYAANTLGAALGALLAGYLIIPALGVKHTTLFAAVLNMLVALLAMKLYSPSVKLPGQNPTPTPTASPIPATADTDSHKMGWIGIVVLGVGGWITMALETTYIHLLAIVAGNSTYAFALMLFTFLLGIAVGSLLGKRLLTMAWPQYGVLMSLEYALAAVLLLGVFQWGSIPGYFNDFSQYPLPLAFQDREFIRGSICWLAMFPPALAIGAIYPVALECVGQAFSNRKFAAMGYAMGLNTLGNIAGVVIGGFVLLPMVGALRSIQILAGLAIALGMGTGLWAMPKKILPSLLLPALCALMFVFQPNSFDYTALASGANVYFSAHQFGSDIDHAESLDGGLTSVVITPPEIRPPIKTLLTNGKFQGNDSELGEVKAQVGFALAPLLHCKSRNRALVIGYGTGMSARTLYDAGFADLEIAELSADIINLANRHFAPINRHVSEAPGVATHIADGRNFLLLSRNRYDLISMEISSIWFAGAASLYNQEFYRLARTHLEPDGVLQQWIQLHHMRQQDLISILATISSEFRLVWLYFIGDQGILVASNSDAAEPMPEYAKQLQATSKLKSLLSLYGGETESLRDSILLRPTDVQKLFSTMGIARQSLLSNDDNLYLEYSTPKGNALNDQSLQSNLTFLKNLNVH